MKPRASRSVKRRNVWAVFSGRANLIAVCTTKKTAMNFPYLGMIVPATLTLNAPKKARKS